MSYHVIDQAVNTLRVASVVEEGGIGVVDGDQLPGEVVEVLCFYSRLYEGLDLREDLVGEITRLSYLDDLHLEITLLSGSHLRMCGEYYRAPDDRVGGD